MKTIKHIALGSLLFFSVFCAALYSSCSKDACAGVTCLNTGTCNSGVCVCPTGTGGNNCEKLYRKLYAYTYKGTSTYDIIGADPNNTLAFEAANDTPFTKMQLVWTNPGHGIYRLPVVLTTTAATGANFVIPATPIDTFTYDGTGSINGTTVSMTITKNHPIGPKIVVSFNDFNRQP